MSAKKNQNNADKIGNPWESVSIQDYNQHMRASSVLQSQTLGYIMRSCLQRVRPETVLVLGCVDGNGFEYIDDSVTNEVVGLDINCEFLKRCKSRFGNKKYSLDLICCDFENGGDLAQTFDFISCALFLEYVDARRVLVKIKSMMNSGSKLNIVIQRNNGNRFVSDTGLQSLESLADIAKEISDDDLCRILGENELIIEDREVYALPNGKEFISYCCCIA